MSSAIDYAGMLRDAGRQVVRRVLAQVAQEGLPGEHHFFVTFDTTQPGVEMSPGLRRHHPQAMTIVLQNQFWELAVDDEAFAVTLRFGGSYEPLRVPFAALISFLDPSAEFGLNFAASTEAEPAAEETQEEEPDVTAPAASGNLLRFERTGRTEDD